MRIKASFYIACALFYYGSAFAHEEQTVKKEKQIVLAPGYSPLQFDAPLPGSYELPPLGEAKNGVVLDSEGRRQELHEFFGDKVVLLSFIYASCSDVNGCPLATAVFHKIQQHLKRNRSVASQLRLLTLSFDPEHDTPDAMRRYGESFQDDDIDWRFLTTKSERELAPILEDYHQTRLKEYDEQGESTGSFSHTLRVYLIDKKGRFRNIYSVSFLHPDTLLSDVKTLLLEIPEGSKRKVVDAKVSLHGTGDDKTGYESNQYQTRTADLGKRVGKKANLLELGTNPPLGLPVLPQPENNKLTADKISLGRKLFYDRRLSLNNTFSCAMCHLPEQGFTSNEMALAVGIEGRTVRRNSPTLYNVGYAKKLFHDGRDDSLEEQIWGPLLAHSEMGNPSVGVVTRKIKALPDYTGLFEKAFNQKVSMETLGMALASYQRTLNSANSPFDRWYYGEQPDALGRQAQQGFKLFTGKARCISCHTIKAKSALFTDHKLHNTGHGFSASTQKEPSTQRILVAPGQYLEISSEVIASVGEKKPNDVGLYEITENPADRWKYKTPTLRNVALTAPYMHDGAMQTLREVVEFYNGGGVANEELDPLMQPLKLQVGEIDDLVLFLESLTGDNIDLLISDAFAAPVGDPN
ncbi:MAG: photosynthetic protein synthase I [Gammaproteobacteria bacterium]|nr:MAG: photosynthetic protein synthase I [Gammaproteobacteria bacterium]